MRNYDLEIGRKKTKIVEYEKEPIRNPGSQKFEVVMKMISTLDTHKRTQLIIPKIACLS